MAAATNRSNRTTLLNITLFLLSVLVFKTRALPESGKAEIVVSQVAKSCDICFKNRNCVCPNKFRQGRPAAGLGSGLANLSLGKQTISVKVAVAVCLPKLSQVDLKEWFIIHEGRSDQTRTLIDDRNGLALFVCCKCVIRLFLFNKMIKFTF